MTSTSSFALLLFHLFLSLEVWSYEAPEDKQDVFARRACPAFLTFTNVAYLWSCCATENHNRMGQEESLMWKY
eukprot:superscaffoldBa00001749_g11864